MSATEWAGIALFAVVIAVTGWMAKRHIRQAGSRSALGWYASMVRKGDYSSYGRLLGKTMLIGLAAVSIVLIAQATLGL